MRNSPALKIARIAVVAALYVALSLAISPLTFGALQIRFSEMLVLMCVYNRDYCWSMILGCVIVNCFSPFGVLDVIFGTLGTVLSVFAIRLIKKQSLAFIPPTICTFTVAITIWLVGDLHSTVAAWNMPALAGPLAFLLVYAVIAAGELIAVGFIGTPVFIMLSKRKDFLHLIGADDRYYMLCERQRLKKLSKKPLEPPPYIE